jgi:hypothetical protein
VASVFWPLMSLLGLSDQVEEMPFMNFFVHSHTCCSDRHASPYCTFIRRWISMGFTPSLLKKRMTERCSSLVHVASGAAIFRLLLAVVLHSFIVLPPVGYSSNHEEHCCQLTRQSSCVSNFYRTFKVFIWISHLLRQAVGLRLESYSGGSLGKAYLKSKTAVGMGNAMQCRKQCKLWAPLGKCDAVWVKK